MTQIDHSIYFQQETPDLFGAYNKGLKMRDLIDARKLKKKELEDASAIEDIHKKNIVVGDDGQVSYNKQALLSDLAKVNPQKAYEVGQAFDAKEQESEANKLKNMKNKIEMTGQLLSGVNDQKSYSSALARAQELGLVKHGEMPMQYDPKLVERAQMQVLSYKDQLDQKWKQKDYEIKKMSAQADMAKSGASGDSLKERLLQARQAEKEQNKFVPGLGYALTSEDAKKLKDSSEMKKKFDRQIGELIALREDKGVEYLDRESVARGKQLSKDLLLTYKNLAKLGVLSQSDENIINAIIPDDPLGQDWSPGQDPVLHQLKKFKGDLQADYDTTTKTRLKPNDVANYNFDSLSDQDLDKLIMQFGGK